MTYRVNSWGNGFTAEVTIVNRSATPVSGWTLQWAFGANQRITGSWNVSLTQSGRQVTAKNAAWNASLGTASFGFQGTHDGSNPVPDAFTLNGTACSVG
ncbi:oxidoreductase [Planomonospora sphaerica]|uniref:Oxidoreductase n=1 Tax=Planomonospora sphaerica TaxID=161355 RepID=A0A161LN38_9ACTN|nr:oxidoreductase [Planomonospora sphaerica]